jgi:hypothetical protein
MPNLSQIELPSGSVYDISDATARQNITTLDEKADNISSQLSSEITRAKEAEKKNADAIEVIRGISVGAMSYIGETTTALTDGSDVSSVVINNQTVTPKNGNVVIYGKLEFVWSSSTNTWHEFGSTGTLKALAFKNNVSASYTPAGTISAPTISVDVTTDSVTPIANVGTLPSATMPSFSANVTGEKLVLGWSAGSFSAGSLPTKGTPVTVATGIKSASATKPIFTGISATITSE